MKYLALLLAFTLAACSAPYPIPEPIYVPVATVEYAKDANKTYYNAQNLAGDETFEFTLDGSTVGHPETSVSAIDVYLSYNGRGRQLYKTYTQLPTVVSLPAAEVAAKFSKKATELALGDRFTLNFTVKTPDGRAIDTYAANICNLIRVEGVCSVDWFVLNPVIPVATGATGGFSRGAIVAGTPTSYRFALDQRIFRSTVKLNSVDVMVRRTPTGGAIGPAVSVKTVAAGPGAIALTPAEVATALGVKPEDFRVGDVFTVFFRMNPTGGQPFTNYLASSLCGVNFPTNILHPLNTPWTDRTTASPPATSMSGTCSLSFSVTP